MQIKAESFSLSLYYQDQFYNYRDILQQAKQFLTSPDSPVSVSAADAFQTVSVMVRAYNSRQAVFPVPDNYPREKITDVLSRLKTINRQLDPDSKIALAIATSGSQKEPAIALISFKNILSHCRNFLAQVPMSPDSMWLNCMPLQHIAGVVIIYRCALSGSSMLLHNGFNARKVWQDLHQYPVSHISLVPAMLSQLLKIQDDSKQFSLPESLKYVIVGGDRISPVLYQQALEYGWPVLISYGMTEATSTIALGKRQEELTPLAGFELRTDNTDNLYIRGDMVISRYLNNRGSSFENSWFKTSDRVVLKQGKLQVTGRNDHMIIAGGENLSPEYIESLLIKAPMIKDIAVGSVVDEIWGQSIAVLVDGELEAFKTWLEKHIKSVYRPRYFVSVSAIPRTFLGKIDRRRVQAKINCKYS